GPSSSRTGCGCTECSSRPTFGVPARWRDAAGCRRGVARRVSSPRDSSFLEPCAMLPELRDLFAYNHWANERILDACEPLSPADLTRELGGSFPSVWTTLTHIYGAENTWLARWNGSPPGSPSDLGEIDDIARLREKWRSLWERQSQHIAEATDAD